MDNDQFAELLARLAAESHSQGPMPSPLADALASLGAPVTTFTASAGIASSAKGSFDSRGAGGAITAPVNHPLGASCCACARMAKDE